MSQTFVDDLCAQAADRPQATAIRTPDGEISYRELVDRIELLARTLRQRGLGPERVCVIAVERNVEALIAMAAVVRAGGAFLALDVELPAERLAAMCRSGRAGMLLTTAALAGELNLPVVGPIVLIDEAAAELTDLPDWPPPVNPRSLAYVSHTSGSTVTPNAVLIEQRGLRAYLRFLVRDYQLGPHTVALQVAPIGYDASIRDMFAPLLAGGQLIMTSRSALLRADECTETIAAFAVNTLLSVTPSFLTFLATRDGASSRLAPLSLVVCSGESLLGFLGAGYRGLVGGRLVNQYGPTECTMTSTRFLVPAQPDPVDDLIGTPIDNVSIRLLDPALAPVPDGATGEIYIGGVGVARGYSDKPALTADRFVPDPAGHPGTRLYRTGDLGRRREDGNVVYLGRLDRQLKIRGYRVHPAEIEGALLAHPAVTGAAITAERDDRGRIALTAHVSGELADVSDAQLRAHLATSLPPYMMPRRFVRIDRFPTTHSGKVDRSNLAAAMAPDGVP